MTSGLTMAVPLVSTWAPPQAPLPLVQEPERFRRLPSGQRRRLLAIRERRPRSHEQAGPKSRNRRKRQRQGRRALPVVHGCRRRFASNYGTPDPESEAARIRPEMSARAGPCVWAAREAQPRPEPPPREAVAGDARSARTKSLHRHPNVAVGATGSRDGRCRCRPLLGAASGGEHPDRSSWWWEGAGHRPLPRYGERSRGRVSGLGRKEGVRPTSRHRSELNPSGHRRICVGD